MLCSQIILETHPKNDLYVTLKGVKPIAYLGNRIREQFDVFEKSFEHSKGVF